MSRDTKTSPSRGFWWFLLPQLLVFFQKMIQRNFWQPSLSRGGKTQTLDNLPRSTHLWRILPWIWRITSWIKHLQKFLNHVLASCTLLRLFFLVLTISLFSSMDGAPLVPKRFRSMLLHASSSWHVSITYMPPTSCSPFLSYAYYLMPNDLLPHLSLIIYTLFVLCPPCLFRIIYIHTPYAFHTLTMLSLVYKRL